MYAHTHICVCICIPGMKLHYEWIELVVQMMFFLLIFIVGSWSLCASYLCVNFFLLLNSSCILWYTLSDMNLPVVKSVVVKFIVFEGSEFTVCYFASKEVKGNDMSWCSVPTY